MSELKPCRINAEMQELLDDIDVEREINKIKADAVREAKRSIIFATSGLEDAQYHSNNCGK